MIRFEIDADELTINDFLMFEDVQEGVRPVHGMTGIMSRFMIGEDGEKLENAAAMNILGAMTLKDFTAVSQQFAEAIQRKAIPPKKSVS